MPNFTGERYYDIPFSQPSVKEQNTKSNIMQSIIRHLWSIKKQGKMREYPPLLGIFN